MDLSNVSPLVVYTTAISILVVFLSSRLVHVIRSIQNNRRRCSDNDDTIFMMASTSSKKSVSPTKNTTRQIKTMVVLGSGGHTTEMIRLLRELDVNRYAPVIYVVANSDTTSIPRLQKFIREEEKNGLRQKDLSLWRGRHPDERCGGFGAVAAVHRLPRAREVHQSYLTSIFTTLHSFIQTLLLLIKVRPELILANGPGTCVPVVYAAFILRILTLGYGVSSKVVFVESLCRVQTLSLSGRLVYPIVDSFVVHWPYLQRKYPLVEVCDVFVLQHDGQ